jgi:hypothetical protein
MNISAKVCARLIAAAALATVLGIGDGESAVPERWHARLSLKLTPDVPNPRDPTHLSTLTANPLYQITWVEGDGTNAVVDLIGPATDYHCEDEIRRLGRDAHIMDLKVPQGNTERDRSSGP